MGWLKSVFGSRGKPSAERSPFLPILMPPHWPGGAGNDCCRRLFGSTQQVEEDPWVALAREDRGDGIDIFPPGGLGVLGEVLGEPLSFETAEALACRLLDDRMRNEQLRIEGLGDADDLAVLVHEDFAASFILHTGVLTHMEEQLGGGRLFIAIPTRATIYFGGGASAAGLLFDFVKEVQDRVPAEAHLTSAIFMAQGGKLVGMGRNVRALGLTLTRDA